MRVEDMEAHVGDLLHEFEQAEETADAAHQAWSEKRWRLREEHGRAVTELVEREKIAARAKGSAHEAAFAKEAEEQKRVVARLRKQVDAEPAVEREAWPEVLRRLRKYNKGLPAGTDTTLDESRPKPKRADTIEAVRAEIAQLETEREKTREAPRPLSVVWPEIAAAIEQKAMPPYLGQLFRPGSGVIEFPQTFKPVAGGGIEGADDAIALLAWAAKPLLLAAFEAHAKLAARESEAMTTEQRAAKLDEIAEKLWPLEAVEEALIRQAAGRGQTIRRREFFDSRIVLGLRPSLPPDFRPEFD